MNYYKSEKTMKKHLLTALVFILSVVFLAGCAADELPENDYTVRVMLRPCDGITIEGDNIVDITAGRNVSFKVRLDEGYIYLGNTANGEFDAERGRLRLTDVIAPATVDMIVVKEEDIITLKIKKNIENANVYQSGDMFAYPSAAQISAEETENLKFEGWSENGYLADGGTLISENRDYSFDISESKVIYANFSGFSEYTITYHLNGGAVRDTVSDTYTVSNKYSDVFVMQQTLESNGNFLRNGYVAVGYSTEPAAYEDYDSANLIPGFSNMGGVCRVRGSGLDLYVVWAKAAEADQFEYSQKKISYISDSSYSWGNLNQNKSSTDGIEITKYIGSDKTVVIPEEIDGLPVMSLAKGAFSGDIERVVIPKTVKNIKDGAFSDCDKLTEVVFFDSVVEVSDKSFPKSVNTVVLNAQRLPVYSGAIEGSFNIKYMRLRQVEGKKIVIVSGSSSLNGINSPLLEELMPGYSVVNYGTNAANPSLFFLEVISKYTTAGDIVVHAPEYYSDNAMGSNQFHAKVFRGCEQCYDIFRDVDISNYSGFWDCFRKFQVGDSSDSSLVPAIHQSGKEYQLDTEINKYGDRSTVRKKVSGSFGSASEVFSYRRFTGQYLNEVNKKIAANGGVLLMSFAPYDKSRLNHSAAVQAEYDKFTQSIADKIDYPLISNVGTYVMEHKHFFDSEWHLNDEGAAIRTRNLAEDIKAYLADPQSYK